MQRVQNNGTFYLYAYVVRSGKPLDRRAADFDPDSVAVKQHGAPPHTTLVLSPFCPCETQTNALTSVIPAPNDAFHVNHHVSSAPAPNASSSEVTNALRFAELHLGCENSSASANTAVQCIQICILDTLLSVQI